MNKIFSVIVVKNDMVSVIEVIATDIKQAATKTIKILGITKAQRHLYKLYILSDYSSN